MAGGCGCGGTPGDCPCGDGSLPPADAPGGEDPVFFEKHCDLPGAASPGNFFASDPIDTTDFGRLTVEALFTGKVGFPTVTVLIGTSMELVPPMWWEPGALPLAEGTVGEWTLEAPMRYARVRVQVDGADTLATVWVKGVLRRR